MLLKIEVLQRYCGVNCHQSGNCLFNSVHNLVFDSFHCDYTKNGISKLNHVSSAFVEKGSALNQNFVFFCLFYLFIYIFLDNITCF